MVTYTRRHVKILLTLICLGFLSSNLYAQLPAATFCDGNPSSWDGYRSNSAISYTHDVANAATATDDNFKQAKDVNDISTWTWWLKGANDKGDITNAGALLKDGILSFFGDRTDVSGACNIGFWFLKNNVSKSGASPNGTFSAGHAIGDLLVLIELSQGGTLASPKVYQWTASGLVQNTAAEAYACAGANPNDNTAISTAFDGYTNKDGENTYEKNAFFEGAINLAAAGLNQCFSTFIVETRQSPSTTAALEDFALGAFNAVPAAPTPVNNARCGNGSITLSPTGCASGIIQWYTTSSSTTSPTPFHTGATYTNPNLTATTTYYISCKVGTCESGRVAITATKNDNPPPATLTVVQPSCSTTLGSITVTAPIGSDYRYSFDGGTTFGTTLSTTFAAGAGYSVIVKNNVTGCISTTTSCPAQASVTQATPDNKEESLQATKPMDIFARIEGKTKVLAAPNPFTDKVRFTLQSDVSGQGSLELYNMMGQKVATVYQGYVEADKKFTKEYSVPLSKRSNLIYVFRVGDQKITGKLLNW